MILAFAVLCLSAAALAKEEAGICGGDGNAIKGFGRPRSRNDPTIKRDMVNVRMPCKYHAVNKQECGGYQVTVTPGNIYLHPFHYLDTLWVSVKKRDGSGYIDMRTTNKKVVKFINEEKTFFFTRKDGDLEVEDIFDSKVAPGKEPTAVAENKDFRITFTAWDPDNTGKNITKPKWSFECLAENFEPLNYTQQLCGGNSISVWQDERGFQENVEYSYYDVFTTPEIVQTNEKCTDAEDLFSGNAAITNCTTYDKQLLAIHTCSPILHDRKRNKCVTKYVCDAMDVFLSCVKWVCSDYTWEEECAKVGEAIDFCREFKNGGLSEKVEKEECYKEYLRLPEKYYENHEDEGEDDGED